MSQICLIGLQRPLRRINIHRVFYRHQKWKGTPLAVRSPLYQIDDSYRFKRGLLTHNLLQYLPDIDAKNRERAGCDFLKRQASDVTTDVQESIVSETCAILSHPEFEMFFCKWFNGRSSRDGNGKA